VILSLLLVPALHVTLIGALGGLVGAFAYLDKRIFFAESVTHGTFPGAVLGVVIAAALGLGHSGMSAALYVGAFLGTIPLVALMRSLASIPGILLHYIVQHLQIYLLYLLRCSFQVLLE